MVTYRDRFHNFEDISPDFTFFYFSESLKWNFKESSKIKS